MSWHWKELLPLDSYTVRATDYLHELDQKVLTLLYQPLIGAFAHSLYMTLWSHLEKDVFWSKEQPHRLLMTMLASPLNVIYEERKKLEGIGLLKTYKKKEVENALYVYELQPPMNPATFFSNDVLSVYLFNRLGKTKYIEVRERFMVDELNKDEFIEMTYAFDEVFTSLHHSEIVANHQTEFQHVLNADQERVILNREEEELFFNEQFFDFELLVASLSNIMNTKKLFSKKVRETILRLAFVYRVEPLEMSDIIQQSIRNDEEVDLDELRKKVQQWYRFVEGNEPPVLGLRKVQPKHLQSMNGKIPETDYERYILKYETQSPLFILQERAGGVAVPPADMKIAESLIIDYKLQPGVANVLLDSVMLQNDMKLSKNLVEKIAGHWARKGIETVKEAMDLAKQEYQKIQALKKGTGQKTAQKNKGRSQMDGRKEKLPKWLLEEKEGKKQEVVVNTSKEFIEKKKQFEEMVKRHEEMKLGRK